MKKKPKSVTEAKRRGWIVLRVWEYPGDVQVTMIPRLGKGMKTFTLTYGGARRLNLI